MRRRRRGAREGNRYYCAFDGDDNILLDIPVNAGVVNYYSFWIKTENQVDNNTILGENDFASLYHLLYKNNTLYYRIQDYVITFPNIGLNDGEWHHIVIVRNNENIDLYINATYLSSQTIIGTNDSEFDIIGSRPNNSLYFIGNLDTIAICISNVPSAYSGTVPSVVRYLYGGGTPQTGGNIKKLSGLTAGYDFESSSNNFIDISGNGHNGTGGGDPQKVRY